MLSEVRFGSYLVYSPRGTSAISVKSRRWRDAIKSGVDEALRTVVHYLVRDLKSTGLSVVLGSDVTLVPAPGSSLLVEGAFWGPRWIASELVRAGLGKQVFPCLSRTTAVPKSAFQPPGGRPTARHHYDTMRVEELALLGGERITIVDDFVTKGSTLLGAASRLGEACPTAQVSAFALIRTMGLQPEVERMVEPCVGTIRLVGQEASRDP